MRLRRALDEFVVDGIQTTIPLFRDLVDDPDIAAGRLRHPLAREEARQHGWQRSRIAMTGRDDIILEITPQVLLKAYACGIFPMAESADDPGLYWIEPEARGIMPLDRFHLPRRLARTVRAGRLRDPHRPRFRRRDRRLRRAGRGPAPRPGSTPASAGSMASSSRSAIATRSRPGRTASWSAGSTACGSARRSSARACSAASATPRRWRWSISSRG